MKFAHEYKEALQREGYPPEWVESAVPYAQLKKCVKKVQSELRSLGLDPETLSQLIHESGDAASRRGGGVAFQYEIDGSTKFVPKLTLFIREGDKFAVDAALSPETRAYLEQLAAKQQGGSGQIEEILDDAPEPAKENHKVEQRPDHSLDRPGFKRVEVPLTFDVEFFDMLSVDVMMLDKFQTEQQEVLTENIKTLSTQLVRLAQPSRLMKKTDLYRWRELFEIYLASAIFFSTNEHDHGTRDSATAARQLEFFQKEVMRRGLLDKFKLPESGQALSQFICINIKLLQNLKFLEINQKAISKIIKKFDKRTQLGATKTFPRLMQSDAIISGSMAKAVCAQVTQDIVQVVPQIDDYLCPVCFSIVWRPVRIKCKHIFCIRCAIKLERTRKSCPLCRKFTLVNLTEDDLDEEMTAYLKKWFPKEVREKQIQNETEQGREDLGPGYVHPSESKCAVM
ncbi:uncharacterized protein PAC_07287 [Phialocephala subalpina]|uniref:RING-14 protein n=1 Tax=Phialocephala subalpina TaxID=576137 RepID=A0A1L7WXB2_9HELO|nr:uncharacterized protein PAC_07287 [Phialocephala subalpina]